MFHVENFDKEPNHYYYAYRPGHQKGFDVHNIPKKDDYFYIEVLRDEKNRLQFRVDGNETMFNRKEGQLFDSECPYFEKIYWIAFNSDENNPRKKEFEVLFDGFKDEYY